MPIQSQMQRRLLGVPAMAALLFVSGCITGQSAALPMVRYEAERDLDCPGAEIRIEEELSGFFSATGCGRRARYRAACEGLSCTVSPENGPAIPWRDRPPPTPVPQ